MLSKLKNLDAYPKVNEDFFQRTLSGGIITIASSILMLCLFISEFSERPHLADGSLDQLRCWPIPYLRRSRACIGGVQEMRHPSSWRRPVYEAHHFERAVGGYHTRGAASNTRAAVSIHA